MVEVGDPGQAGAEGPQAAELEPSEPEGVGGARAIEPRASVSAGAEVVAAEDTRPQVSHSPLRASEDSSEDFVWMFEQMNSLDKSPIGGDRACSTSSSYGHECNRLEGEVATLQDCLVDTEEKALTLEDTLQEEL
ncbi:hypothetical protein GUJ93_ZPchr0002g25956 [Zizania palustris]|uniref:Uncharacterized protein n=1 Tax=Zizania palustris TaxID=103762 RepID=A0A8J5VWI3_ZIZPA|nr:hypothetical protein GUJ93_ZPchr0002g25956 [Zizania palustris]